MKIYLDMDGVLADFDDALLQRGVLNCGTFIHLPRDQWTAEQRSLDEAVRSHMEKEDFWPSIPLMKGAQVLLATAISLAPTMVLTATPSVTAWRDRIARDKRDWMLAKMGLPHDRVITCLRSEKKQYANGYAVLVDDLAANCKDWESAGGIAIQFLNTDQAVADLKEAILGTQTV